MPRPITLFTGQWADLPLKTLAEMTSEWGFDGLELACWGDHFEVDKALEKDSYVRENRDLLESFGLDCFAISNHLVGQAVSDPIDHRHQSIVPARVWGDGKPDGVQQRAAQEMIHTAEAAKLFGVDVVNGFTGSPVWHMIYFFPPTSQGDINAGYAKFAADWLPILDAFQAQGVRFGLEVHPTEIAYDIVTAHRALAAVNHHPAFGFNFDPSHLVHQFVDPALFIDEFADRIFHAHIKDTRVQVGDGRRSILGSHLDLGDHRRGWNFVSPGRGDVDFDLIIRALNRANYTGPLSIEWEDSDMDRAWGAQESLDFVRSQDFDPSNVVFDAAFQK